MKELNTKYIAILVLVCIILFLSYPYIVSVMEWFVGVN